MKALNPHLDLVDPPSNLAAIFFISEIYDTCAWILNRILSQSRLGWGYWGYLCQPEFLGIQNSLGLRLGQARLS